MHYVKPGWRGWVLLGMLIGAAFLVTVRSHRLTTQSSDVSIDVAAGIASSSTPGQPPRDQSKLARDPQKNGALLHRQAMNAWHAGEIRQAMSLFEQAIRAAPDAPAPHSDYGRLLTLMVSYQKALPLLERARDLRPDDAQVWLDLATLYERTQLFEKSWAARARAAELVGAHAIGRDEQGRFIVQGNAL